MKYNKNMRKYFFQLGLRLLHPRIIFSNLLCHTDWVSMDCYDRIVQAYRENNSGLLGWRTFLCEIEWEEFIVNIATGRRVNADDEDIIVSFPNWAHYENFIKEIIDATIKYLKNKGLL